MSCIYSPTPNSKPGCKFLIPYFLKSQPFLTPGSDLVFKCEYVKLEVYGKVWGNVRSLRSSLRRSSMLDQMMWEPQILLWWSWPCPEREACDVNPYLSPSFMDRISEWNCPRQIFSCKQIHMMEFEELVSVGAQQDSVVWNAAFSVFCLAGRCHREQVLSKQHEQGFELENEQDLDNIVIVACLLKNFSVVHKEVIKKTRKNTSIDLCLIENNPVSECSNYG